jgi:von Willebrand factor type A C-terminal domain/von Willebrand factor type A domain
VTTFSAAVHQNVFLPRGSSTVHAILSVSAREGEGGGWDPAHDGAVEVIMVDCSGSMAFPSSKIAAARTATSKAIDRFRDGTWFAIIAGSTQARMIYPQPLPGQDSIGNPALARASTATRAAAKDAVNRLDAGGGTAISTWLGLARQVFETRPGAIKHALLLTDGRNESEEGSRLTAELERCLGGFQCDCRGFGTDWDRVELQGIADTLLGTTDIIPKASLMEAEFEAIIQHAMSKRVGSVFISLLSPIGGRVKFFKQVSPEVLDLTAMAVWQQPVGASGQWEVVTKIDPSRPMVSLYPTGAWADDEDREYHVCLTLAPQPVGPQYEVRAARIGVLVDGVMVTQIPVRTAWSDDVDLTTRIDPAVAHFTGQEELARSIEEGLAARRAGDYQTATYRLGRAASLAHAAGNRETTRLLLRVVDIEDPERGTVRLKSEVSKEDEMTLDTRSRRTVRLNNRTYD